MNWQPTASVETLKHRAKLIREIRYFFDSRGVVEVDTPLLQSATVTDPYLQSIRVGINKQHFYLQTSPEYAMKRLLAAGIGSIYQICKAFRRDENGRFHHTEFTMLEWYRIGFTHHDLMNEMDALLQRILKTSKAIRLSYKEVFEKFLGINPHTISLDQLGEVKKKNQLNDVVGFDSSDKNLWLQVLMSELIEPQLMGDAPFFIYDYPASQAALAKIKKDESYSVAERFEVYINGIELANGFHELCDANEQRLRFVKDLKKREQSKSELVPVDEKLLSALENGLPACAGVALGVDRLMMLALGKKHIQEVISFLN